MNNQKYNLQKGQFLGGFAFNNYSNSAVGTATSWSVPVDANCSIIRMYSDEMAYMKYGTSANSSVYDYLIPPNSSLDIYNMVQANTVSFVANANTCSIKVSEY
jgi:hypothetical protein